MVDAVGLALAAWVTRFGPVEEPWAMVVQLTGGSVLAARAGLHGRR